MRFRLRTLLIVMTVAPPLLAGVLVVRSDPFQLFLAIGFLAYFLFALAVGVVFAWACELVQRIL
jgi:hypothetical protein